MDKTISRKFFNDRAEHWDDTVRNNDAQKLRRMADRLDIQEPNFVLDVGTGTGVFIPYISEKLNGSGRIISMDFAINMLIKAQSKFSDRESLEYVCAEIEALHLGSAQFDTAVCYSTFPHFHDKPRALRNLTHLLKKNGTLFICHTASKETINDIHRSIPDFQDHLIPDNDEMAQLLEKAGFVQVKIEDNEDYYLVTAKNRG
ncbi:class I SAM-dependent methyltransferase [Pelolinea submarina]|uniref:Demethylmenaquinone methyltransferase/2-methoxy-6-polyprenyl-1,4-benzoquinol methylase n=1 Tax=Pelolinea submarina TaxID=913107 RepID=A0A3E0A8G8_9CHLR|nr:class I SAM-dependent methyltransferase [Pelolinea submarina]REG07224.1 demethylmenaquinone methyltransferase/2-methoxy-6-polyprenyl-1,4-benzoquinol methylase [Pelolinea submarina]